MQKINRFPSVVNKLTGLTVLYKKKKIKKKKKNAENNQSGYGTEMID